MKKIALIVLVAAVAVTNAPAQTNNPAPPAADQASKPPAKQDQGIRKLSRRERKDRIKNLGEKYRQFLRDVEPIMQPSELDTFLILETDAQRDIYIVEFWRRRDVARGTTNNSFREAVGTMCTIFPPAVPRSIAGHLRSRTSPTGLLYEGDAFPTTLRSDAAAFPVSRHRSPGGLLSK